MAVAAEIFCQSGACASAIAAPREGHCRVTSKKTQTFASRIQEKVSAENSFHLFTTLRAIVFCSRGVDISPYTYLLNRVVHFFLTSSATCCRVPLFGLLISTYTYSDQRGPKK